MKTIKVEIFITIIVLTVLLLFIILNDMFFSKIKSAGSNFTANSLLIFSSIVFAVLLHFIKVYIIKK